MEPAVYSLKDIIEHVTNQIYEMTKANLNYVASSDIEREQIINRKKRFQEAYQDCIYGSKQDKEFVKSHMKEIIKTLNLNNSNINHVIPFGDEELLTIQDKFDILLHVYKSKYNYSALGRMIQEYGLDNLRKKEDQIYYKITAADIEMVFDDQNPLEKLTLDDKINIIVQRVYSIIKGYKQIDDVIDMKIDGISGGVSGLTESMINDISNDGKTDISDLQRSFESVWIMFRGKSIQLEFLTFGSYEELARTCQNIYAYDNPGQLNESRGYIVNRLKNGSRVVVFVPPFCESYVFFIRKFELDDHSLEFLMTSSLPKKKESTSERHISVIEKMPELLESKKVLNTDIVTDFLKYLAKGGVSLAVTGQQGTGKTTFLKALMKYIYSVYNLRVLELAPEMQLRKLFPDRNIVSVVETQTVSSKSALDVFKKSDGSVTVVGEIASDDVVALTIQLGQVASLFTWFTHHAKKATALVNALRNSALNTGLFSNETIAEEQVLQILTFNIHLAKDIEGRRYIERITEFVPIDNNLPYTEVPHSESSEVIKRIQAENELNYYKRLTERKLYKDIDIVKFDLTQNSYVFINPISEKSYKLMCKEMITEDSAKFKEFYKKMFENIQ